MDSYSDSDLIDTDLALRYLRGEVTNVERTIVCQWLASDPTRTRTLDAMRAVSFDSQSSIASDGDVERAWTRVERDMARSSAGHVPQDAAPGHPLAPNSARTRLSSGRLDTTRGTMWRRATLAVAVSASAVAAAVAIWSRSSSHHATPGAVRSYATSAGQRTTVTLSDGSRVILAPNSTLRVADAMRGAERRLTLVGEAYVTVAHVSSAPFIVDAGAVSVRVVGTAFTVRRYPHDLSTRIAVLSGKVVAATPGHAPVPLPAYTIARVTDSTAVLARADDMDAELSWTRGTLDFRDTPLADVLTRLNHWYDIDVRVTDSAMAQRLVTGTFAGESRVEALSTLQSVLHVAMVFDSTPGRAPVIMLVPRPAHHPSMRTPRAAHELSPTSLEVGR